MTPALRKALVIGGSGRIGHALAAALAEGWDVVATRRAGAAGRAPCLDLLDEQSIAAAVGAIRPCVVLLAVDGTARAEELEGDPHLAHALFVESTAAVIRAAAPVGARVVLYSTDMVFDGAAGPYTEDDPPAPVTVLGAAKLAAEAMVLSAPVPGLVVRTSEVFGWNRASPNIAMAVWRLVGGSRRMAAPRDWWVTPTLAEDLAGATVELLEAGAESIFHVAGPDRVSRHELAVAVARAMLLDDELIDDEPALPPARTIDAGLVSAKLTAATGYEPLPLPEALRRFRRDWRAGSRVRSARPAVSAEARQLRADILAKVAEYHDLAHRPRPFEPYRSRVSYSGRVYGPEELVSLVGASLDFWLTLGPHADTFERAMRDRFGAADFVLVNAGSTANLTAMLALTSERFEKALRPGDEVITPAVTFPTTLTPIVHSGLVPVFVDCEIGTYNIDPAGIEAAVSERTRAIVIPHTLGNPCDLDVVAEVARRHDLLLVEDICDALGAAWAGRPVGTFGQLATLSFYPAHHITMGEGGGVVVNTPRLGRIVRSVRDWGRDCWCAPGESDTCGRRFGWQLGDLPHGYDHKYVYSSLGYNFKPTDLQAAIGVAQLARLDGFLQSRQANFDALFNGLRRYQDSLILPRSLPRAEPAWFGFPITVQGDVSRAALVHWLEAHNIETRQVFAGNILRQPAFKDIRCRVAGGLRNSERVMRDTFFIGVYPGLTQEMIAFVLEQFDRFFASRPGKHGVRM